MKNREINNLGILDESNWEWKVKSGVNYPYKQKNTEPHEGLKKIRIEDFSRQVIEYYTEYEFNVPLDFEMTKENAEIFLSNLKENDVDLIEINECTHYIDIDDKTDTLVVAGKVLKSYGIEQIHECVDQFSPEKKKLMLEIKAMERELSIKINKLYHS